MRNAGVREKGTREAGCPITWSFFVCESARMNHSRNGEKLVANWPEKHISPKGPRQTQHKNAQ